MTSDQWLIVIQVLGSLLAAAVAFLAARYATDRTIKQTSASNGLQYVITIRSEIRSVKRFLEKVLNNPHRVEAAPGGLRFELPYYGEPMKYAPVFLSAVHQSAGVTDDLLERVNDFYSGLLRMGQESMALGGAIYYVHKQDLSDVIRLADRAVEELSLIHI